jgi:hypothetical protein
MSQNVNGLLDTYVETMKRYVDALEKDDDSMVSFLKEDVDYYWEKLSDDERVSAYDQITEYNKMIMKRRTVEYATED